MIGEWRFTCAVLAIIAIAPMALTQQPKSDSSLASENKARTAGNLEVLSDTHGVDFGPYLHDLLARVRKNWYNLVPEEARPPQLATGVTSIEFQILPTGQIQGMKIVHGSGMLPLDRAVWGGLTASNPFSPLPEKFKGEFLAIRMHFYYNPQKLPHDEQPQGPPPNAQSEKH